MNLLIETLLKEVKNITKSEIYLSDTFVRDRLLKKGSDEIKMLIRDDARSLGISFASLNDGRLIMDHKDLCKVELNKNHEKLLVVFENLGDISIDDYLSKSIFSIEALAMKVEEDGSINFNEIIDTMGGLKDFNNRLVRCVQPENFSAMPVSMLKAVRFMAELDFNLENSTMHSIIENAEFLENGDWEEIAKELFIILKLKKTYYYFNFMDRQLNILNKIFPEIEPMKEIGRCKYHVVDSWTHSLNTLKVAESIIYAEGYFENHLKKAYEEHSSQIVCEGHTRLEIVKLAALFHDIGKPASRKIDESGRVRFKGHEIAGMQIVERISDRLKLGDKGKKILCKLVKEHMWPLTLYKNNDVSAKATYDLFAKFGEDTLDVLIVSLADIIATRKLLYPHEEMGMYKVHVEYLANNYLTRFKDIININHVITESDIEKEFPRVDEEKYSELIDFVRKSIFFGKIPPEKSRAIAYIKEEPTFFFQIHQNLNSGE